MVIFFKKVFRIFFHVFVHKANSVKIYSKRKTKLSFPRTRGHEQHLLSPFQDPEDDDSKEQTEMGYQQTLMYGRYSRSLGDYAKEEAKRQRVVERRRRRAAERRRRELEGKLDADGKPKREVRANARDVFFF